MYLVGMVRCKPLLLAMRLLLMFIGFLRAGSLMCKVGVRTSSWLYLVLVLGLALVMGGLVIHCGVVVT